MSKRALWLLGTGLCIGCPSKSHDDDDDTGSETDADADTDADSDSDSDADADADSDSDSDLPSPFSDIDENYCDDRDFEGTPAHATSYFIGEYGRSGSDWSGTETWALYATPDWEAVGGADCVVVWSITGAQGEPDACTTCDFAIFVSATLDTTATTCPEGLYEGDETFSTAYDLATNDDGTVDWYFHTSGTQFGAGHHDEDHANFATDPVCLFF